PSAHAAPARDRTRPRSPTRANAPGCGHRPGSPPPPRSRRAAPRRMRWDAVRRRSARAPSETSHAADVEHVEQALADTGGATHRLRHGLRIDLAVDPQL